MDAITQLASWQLLSQHRAQIWHDADLAALFSSQPGRYDQFSLQFDALLLDYSKNYLTSQTIGLLSQLADELKLGDAIDQLYLQNNHVMCRQNDAVLNAVASTIDSVPPQIKHVLHVGEGGSSLGPSMVCHALSKRCLSKYTVNFISGYDNAGLNQLLASLDPNETIAIFATKSFSTAETLHNAEIIKNWLLIPHHCYAVTAQQSRALAFGVPEQNILHLSSDLGGRYSVWSSVGLVIALKLGLTTFKQFLSGAAAMDQHFKSAPWLSNMPVMLAFIEIWYRHFFAINNRAVVPYHADLGGLVAYLQQLHMESLGKSVDCHGRIVNYSTGGIVWGGIGTQSQHSYFQLLMQGKQQTSVDFILPLKNCQQQPVEQELITNCLSQSQVMMLGDQSIAVDRRINGNVPSNTLLMHDMSAYSIGLLLALYEHKVFSQSVLWNINAFDQWGVERAKKVATQLGHSMLSTEKLSANDCSTQGLLAYILGNKNKKDGV